MNKLLEHVANRAVGWSVAADRLKARQETARWWVFGLSIAGALLAAVASQLPAEAHASWSAHRMIAMLGALALAIAAFATSRFLGQAKTLAWVRARAASEALKREAFKFAARAAPYDGADNNTAEELLKTECRKIEDGADKLAQPADDPGRKGSAPRDMLTPADYRERRVLDQIQKFYRVKAQQYRLAAQKLKRIEFWLALAAAVITAIAGAMGKTPISGVAFDIAALSAVLTTVSGTILTHIEASRLDHLVETYSATARRLEDQDLDFDKVQQDPAAWSRFVNRCEDIIAAENASWVAKWAEQKS